MGFLDLLKETEARIDGAGRLEAKVGQVYDGHKVCRVIWATDSAVVFQDDTGRFWRFLRDWGRAWPVLIKRKESV